MSGDPDRTLAQELRITGAISESRLILNRPLLVGEDNPRSGNPRHALYPYPRGCAGWRLCQILGLTEVEYLRTFARTNLCVAAWRVAEARQKASKVLTHHRGPVVLLGVKVCEAFGLPFEPFRILRADVGELRQHLLILPHPSGRCRVWNDPSAAPRARDALRRLQGLGALFPRE